MPSQRYKRRQEVRKGTKPRRTTTNYQPTKNREIMTPAEAKQKAIQDLCEKYSNDIKSKLYMDKDRFIKQILIINEKYKNPFDIKKCLR